MGYIIEFKKRLEEVMAEENMNEKNLADKAGIDKSSIYNYLDEFKEQDLKCSTLIKISKAVNTSISYLTGETNVREADDTAIGVRFNIDSKVIENLENIKKINKNYEDKYCDILGELLTSPDLYKVLIESIDTTLKYKGNTAFRNEFNNRVHLDKLGFDEKTRAEIIGSFFWNYYKYLEKKEMEYNISNLSKREIDMQIKRLTRETYRLKKYKENLPD